MALDFRVRFSCAQPVDGQRSINVADLANLATNWSAAAFRIIVFDGRFLHTSSVKPVAANANGLPRALLDLPRDISLMMDIPALGTCIHHLFVCSMLPSA